MQKSKSGLSRREELFLCVVAAASVIASATSLYIARESRTQIVAQQQDDAQRIPLRAGPRTYQ